MAGGPSDGCLSRDAFQALRVSRSMTLILSLAIYVQQQDAYPNRSVKVLPTTFF